jgi:hypothetical protein
MRTRHNVALYVHCLSCSILFRRTSDLKPSDEDLLSVQNQTLHFLSRLIYKYEAELKSKVKLQITPCTTICKKCKVYHSST